MIPSCAGAFAPVSSMQADLWHHPPAPNPGLWLESVPDDALSLVLEAREHDGSSRKALESLCRTYRPPVIAYIRARGANADEAEDLAQAFFTRFVERAFHARADPARGRFRAFLLTALKNFLADASAEANAEKRGGGIQFRSLDSAINSQSGREGMANEEQPDDMFDRAWAHAVLESALRKLRQEARASGKAALFDALDEFLIERPDEDDYARAAQALNMRRNTLAVAVHRMRNRLRELVLQELAQTAAHNDDLEAEMTQLRNSLGAVLQ
jgi:RNA polymerase sigma-70 factor (ECF subfamily)